MSLDRDWAYARRRARPLKPLLLPGLLLLGLLLSLLAYQMLSQGREVSGRVVDAVSGSAVAGALVVASGATSSSDASGSFRLGPVRLGESLSLSADGYVPTELPVGWGARIDATLRPRSVRVQVRDADTGLAVKADLRAGNVTAHRDSQADYVLAPVVPEMAVVIAAPGYRPVEVPYRGQDRLDVTLQPIYGGTLRDADTGQPVGGAYVLADGLVVRTDSQGMYELPGRPASGAARVLAPGYRRAEIVFRQGAQVDLLLEPFEARGAYLTFFGVGHQGIRGNVVRLLETTELNAVVIDIKGDRGWIAYPSAVPVADVIGANDTHTLSDVDEVLRDLKEKGIYTIARMVVFKDDLLARNGKAAGLDVAIKDARTGEPWIDGEGLGWVDPLRKETWDYNIALAKEAAAKGFDEIQFDYIRFPTDPSAGNAVENAVYSRALDDDTRVGALVAFLSRAREEVHAAGAFLSIDTFGYSCWADDDMGIGQHLARLAPHVDYVSPMVYPSTFSAGLPNGIPYPSVVQQPYEVVYQSLLKAQQRTEGSGAGLRPWLQYFDDYGPSGFAYGATQIAAQKKAVADARASGWMFWDPTNSYQRGGFSPAGD